MEWIDVKEKEPPRNEEIIVTNGDLMALTILGQVGDYVIMEPVGFGGYEWEFDFDYKDITHWAKKPELPKIKEF